MIINAIRLHNFKSHADTSVEFGPGINVIIGENGAGKTSILEAISFALFRDYSGSMENLLRRGQKEMTVELIFCNEPCPAYLITLVSSDGLYKITDHLTLDAPYLRWIGDYLQF